MDAALHAGADQAEALVLAGDERSDAFREQPHPPERAQRGRRPVRSARYSARAWASPPRTARAPRMCARAADGRSRPPRRAPEDPDFPGLPGSSPRRRRSTASLPARSRSTPRPAPARPAVIVHASAVARTDGRRDRGRAATPSSPSRTRSASTRRCRVTSAHATVLAMGAGGRQRLGVLRLRSTPRHSTPRRSANEAADLALRSARPAALDPGVYTVVLGPEAVAEIDRVRRLVRVLGEGRRGRQVVHQRAHGRAHRLSARSHSPTTRSSRAAWG